MLLIFSSCLFSLSLVFPFIFLIVNSSETEFSNLTQQNLSQLGVSTIEVIIRNINIVLWQQNPAKNK